MNIRLEAAAAGQKTYQTGIPCKRDHVGPRYTSNGMCVECLKGHAEVLRQHTKVRKIAKNLEREHKIVRHQVMIPVKYSNSGIVQSIENILNGYDAETFITWMAHIEKQPLDTTVLGPMFDWRDNKVNIDPATYPMRNADDGRLLVQLRNAWYVGDEIMEVLRGQRSAAERVWE